MAKSDLRARPIFHNAKQSIDAHLMVVIVGVAVGRWIGSVNGFSLRKFVSELRVHGSVALDAGGGNRAIADVALPPDLAAVVDKIRNFAKPY